MAAGLLITHRLPAQDATVATMLQIRPKFDDVAVSTPSAEELKDCKVEDVKDDSGKKIGYVLLDGRRQILRRYVMGKGATSINTWSFYKDGVEVFRMSASNGKVDQYRWLGTGGMKWGVSTAGDGKIDVWPMISADEVAQEAFLALSTNDFARLKALFITPAEIKALGIPDAAAAKMLQAQQSAAAKFQQAITKQPGLTRANFLRVESAAPGCWLADSQGTPRDVIKHATRSVFFETTDKKHDWFNTGEIIQVGQAWRLVDLAAEAEDVTAPINPKLNKLLADLSELEKRIFATGTTEPGKANPPLAGLYEQRAALCLQIITEAEAKEKENWYKQLLDSLSGAVLAGSETSKKQLDAYQKHFADKMKGSNLAGYASYRQLWALFSPKLVSGDPKAQEAYNEQLVKFVNEYPSADDTADALHQLGMSCEFANSKDKEEEAARWYGAIHAKFPEHHLAEWAKGAERRMRLAGNPLVLAGTLLHGNNQFDINQLKGKFAVIYYWASNSTTAAADFARLKQALSTQKDVDLVCVNLDDRTEKAVAFLQQNAIALQAYHIAQAARDPNGMRGPLANYYGINVLPTLFLVGRDGRVITAKLQIADLEETLKKAVQQ
jgi:hypothetical protein